MLEPVRVVDWGIEDLCLAKFHPGARNGPILELKAVLQKVLRLGVEIFFHHPE
jgi:hypothetical protein